MKYDKVLRTKSDEKRQGFKDKNLKVMKNDKVFLSNWRNPKINEKRKRFSLKMEESHGFSDFGRIFDGFGGMFDGFGRIWMNFVSNGPPSAAGPRQQRPPHTPIRQ